MSFSKIIGSIFSNHFSTIAGTVVAFGVSATMAPEVVFLSKCKDMTVYQEKDGSEKQIDPATKDLIDKVLLKVNMSPYEEASLDFYVSTLSDPTHYGSTKLRSGAYVSLPVSFQYDKNADMSKESISLSGIRLVFDGTNNSQAAQDLANSLLLSQKGKEFLVAREVHYARSYRLHIDLLLRTVAASGAVITWSYFYNRVLVLKTMKTWAKLLPFAIMSVFWTGCYLLLRDAHRCWIDYAVDKKTAKMGKSYAEGGLEYYQSVLERNKALRVLKKDGKKEFTSYGNEVSMIRQKTLQKSTRRDNMKRILMTYEQEEVKDAPEKVKATESQAA